MPLHHIVMFKLTDGDSGGAAAAALDPLIATLVASAPGVLAHSRQADLGLRPGNPRSYQRLVDLTFADAAAFRTYLDSPEHQAFLAAVPDLIESIASVQYEGA